MFDKLKICNEFYHKTINHSSKFAFCCLCCEKANRDKTTQKNKVVIFGDGKQLVSSMLWSKAEKEDFLALIPTIYRYYSDVQLFDYIGYKNPFLEDMCDVLQWKYFPKGNKLSREMKDYERIRRELAIMYDIFE